MRSKAVRWFWAQMCWVLCFAWFLGTASVLSADLDWHPAKAWVFAVGVLEWQKPDVWPGMPNAKFNRLCSPGDAGWLAEKIRLQRF